MSLRNCLERVTTDWTRVRGEAFAGHEFGSFFRNDFKREVESIASSIDDDYRVKASVGAGNWASVPWVSILDPEITTTTQEGVYPVYLFREDGTGFYLSLGFGTTNLNAEYGAQGAVDAAHQLRGLLRANIPELLNWSDDIDLRSNTILGASYQWASAGAKFYKSEDIPPNDTLKQDLLDLLTIYEKCKTVDLRQLGSENENIGLLSLTYPSKPFLLLAGISGTGKTRFVREQADADLSNYQLVSVRPDWHEPSDLLGYITRLTEKEQYVATDVLVFIVKAWKEIVKHGFDLEGDSTYGDIANLQNIRPFWLCLDEMNLAPVEQYFADYLSVSETRKWRPDGNQVTYSCDPLLSSDLIKSVDAAEFKEALFLNDGEDKSERLWTHFSENGISVPFNLIVAGTVNMDETTHGFSRKVIDRALSFDFGEFFPNDFGQFFDPDTSPKGLTYPHWSHADKAALQDTYDVDGERTIAFMQAINDKLEGTPFKLAYRALNEALLSVIANQPSSEHELLAVWDDFVMCKLLPRIEGDLDKLSSNEDNQTLLQVLRGVLEEQLSDIWEGTVRPDLYREYRTEKEHPEEAPQDNSPSRIIWIPCRSKAKLDWMLFRLERDTFTSFWP